MYKREERERERERRRDIYRERARERYRERERDRERERESCLFIHISEPTRLLSSSYAVFCLKKKKKKKTKKPSVDSRQQAQVKASTTQRIHIDSTSARTTDK